MYYISLPSNQLRYTIMILHDAKYLAIQLMAVHDLFDTGWSFEFDGAKRRLGCCNFTHKRISLSKHVVLLNDENIIRNTILHEIAHALVGRNHGHDSIWRQKALEIGCDGNRLCGNSVRVEGKYKAECGSCGRIIFTHRIKKKSASCGICSGGTYNATYKLDFKLNTI